MHKMNRALVGDKNGEVSEIIDLWPWKTFKQVTLEMLTWRMMHGSRGEDVLEMEASTCKSHEVKLGNVVLFI